MFENLIKFINYWYFRYLLVTELFMVEKWERIMIHIVFFIIFALISVANIYAILGLISWTSGLVQNLIYRSNIYDDLQPSIRNEL